MSKSTRPGRSGRGSGTVTVIEQRVHRSAAENARFAFIFTVIVSGLVALVVAKGHMHPLLAAFVAAPIAAVCGALVWALVRSWPVLRMLWWWTPEIGATVLLAWGWTALAASTSQILTAVILAVLVGGPACVPVLRRWTVAIFWCVAVRHRLRVCFSQFIITNRSGSLPLILGAWPTPVGERVWVLLRPGLSVDYLTQQVGKIAVACHAKTVRVDLAGSTNSAFVRFDIKRREVLTAKVSTPLIDEIDPIVPLDDKESATVTGLDLPDIDDIPTATEPAIPKQAAASSNGRKPATAADDGDDINQWI
ncbi:hypothetical protein ACWT_6164 [Actinoplanes sp. SE50]|uniref:hypothetical protein n=1 Tax=unclassified Actinoplanes TaxID=2626549 RepID=UPI00023ECD69|nr:MULTISPECIES: hypothetical protein [unclassified Actinoplanes]AEV87178.1 hypothetical protein ACPL_6296 [Actinoplanes sp. SE50/110]ATO85579.1 hypothetical protein ACWT_6164 [Actinoplanes sp. SE50]SLM02992.1 hypothetical protein ACSP50_6277 [Actinoplanes sp. SE50/110]